MADHKIMITDNGTKTLLTAGKYCDRNIEIETNVPEGLKPAVFTNVLDLDTTIVKKGYRVTGSGYTATDDAVAIVCACSKGNHRIRVRGKYIFGYLMALLENVTTGKFYANVYNSDITPTVNEFVGTAIIYGTTEPYPCGQDEYGDFLLDITTTLDGYIGFTLKDISYTYPDCAFSEKPILTIDEPIGYAEISA